MSNTEQKKEFVKNLSARNGKVAALNLVLLLGLIVAVFTGFLTFNNYDKKNNKNIVIKNILEQQERFDLFSNDLMISVFSEASGKRIVGTSDLQRMIGQSPLVLDGITSVIQNSIALIPRNEIILQDMNSLVTFKNAILQSESSIAKNYLNQQEINNLSNNLKAYQNTLNQIRNAAINNDDNSILYFFIVVFFVVMMSLFGFFTLSSISQDLRVVGNITNESQDVARNLELIFSEITKLYSIKENHATFFFNKKVSAKQQLPTFKVARTLNKMFELLETFFIAINKNLSSMQEKNENGFRLMKNCQAGVDSQEKTINETTNFSQKLNKYVDFMSVKNKEIVNLDTQLKEQVLDISNSIGLVNGRMNHLRESVQETSKKIKRLGESAQSITQTTDLIGNVTKQIQVIALNTAIQASQSGEYGKIFSVIAKEIERLSKNSDEAAKKIEVLIIAIQEDTKTVLEAMENSTKEVVESAKIIEGSLKNISETKNLIVQEETLAKEVSAFQTANVADLQSFSEEAKRGSHNFSELKKNFYELLEQHEQNKGKLEELIHFIRLTRNTD